MVSDAEDARSKGCRWSMTRCIAMEWIDLVMAVVTAGLGGLAGHVASVRQGALTEKRVIRREAAQELRSAMSTLRRTTRGWGRSEHLEDPDVRTALSEWAAILDRHRRRLPAELGDALGSVQSAAGEVFGPAVLAYALPEYEDVPLHVPDRAWQQYLDDFLGYLLKHLNSWSDDGQTHGVRDFDAWLKASST